MNKKKVLIIMISSLVTIACLWVLTFYLLEVLPSKKQDDLQRVITHPYYIYKVEQFKEENKTLTDIEVAFIGDSLTDGCDLNTYYPEFKTINRGIGGDTTFGLEHRLQVSLFDVKPKVVVMLIGANNFKTMMENYESILIKLKENLPDSKIVLLSLTAMNLEWGKNNSIAIENNVKIKKLATKYNFTFVDIFTPLYDINTNEAFANYTVDGGHLTHEGYMVISNELTPVLKQLLNKE